jgi:hypothetical protein
LHRRHRRTISTTKYRLCPCSNNVRSSYYSHSPNPRQCIGPESYNPIGPTWPYLWRWGWPCVRCSRLCASLPNQVAVSSCKSVTRAHTRRTHLMLIDQWRARVRRAHVRRRLGGCPIFGACMSMYLATNQIIHTRRPLHCPII